MNNNFNIFSVAGKIIQDTIFKMNAQSQPKPNVPFQEVMPGNINNYIGSSNVLAEFLANVKTQNMEFAQASAFMKDILNLPQEFKDLISQRYSLQDTEDEPM